MPTIHLENCTKCLMCVRDCPSDAIDIDQGTINDSCIHCGHCVAICPESTVFPDSESVRPLQPISFSSQEFEQLSARIRTCRSFQNKEVDQKTLELLIENMKHYPSASNSRPLELTIVKSREKIKDLNDRTAEKLISTLKLITSPLLMPVLQVLAPEMGLHGLKRYKKRFIARQSPESSQICHHAPAVLLFHAPVTKYGMAAADAYIWATYTSLYASTLGLGTCFNGFIVKAMERSKGLRKEFNIPSSHQVYASLLLGFPKVKYRNEAGREKPALTYL